MEDLVIPLKIDSAGALAELAKLAAQGTAATKPAVEGAKEATTAYEKLAQSVIGMVQAQMGISLVQQSFSALKQGLEEASKHAATVAQEFTKLRAEMAQVAALTGGKGDATTTVQQAEYAAAANLKPGEWKDFQEKFQAYAGAYIGDQEGAKLSTTQATGIQQRVAEFAKARGIRPDEAASLMGTVIQEAKPGTSAEDMLARFGSLFQVAEKAYGPTGPLLAKIQELTASGINSGESAKIANIFAEGASGEEATYGLIAQRSLSQLRLSGEGEKLGLKKGQSALEMMKAAAKSLDDQVAGGADEDELISKYFKDSREQRAMRILLNRGQRAKGFERTDQMEQSVDKGYIESTINDWENTPEGRQQSAEGLAALNRVRRGARQEETEIARKEAEAKLEGEGRFEQFQVSDIPRALFGQGSKRDQLIQEQAIAETRKKAEALGVDASGLTSGYLQLGTEPNEKMIEVLERIRAATEAQAAAAAARPLAAPPPNPPTRP